MKLHFKICCSFFIITLLSACSKTVPLREGKGTKSEYQVPSLSYGQDRCNDMVPDFSVFCNNRRRSSSPTLLTRNSTGLLPIVNESPPLDSFFFSLRWRTEDHSFTMFSGLSKSCFTRWNCPHENSLGWDKKWGYYCRLHQMPCDMLVFVHGVR